MIKFLHSAKAMKEGQTTAMIHDRSPVLDKVSVGLA